MFTLPDLKQKQIIFFDTTAVKGCKLSFGNDNLVISDEEKIINKISVHKILTLYILGTTTLTTNIIKECMARGISIYLLKNNLECYGSIQPMAEGNYILKKIQYTTSELKELKYAKNIVHNKCDNQLRLLGTKGIKTNLNLEQIKTIKDEKVLLAFEGNLAKTFFQLYYQPIDWRNRMPRTKIDIPNLLLDIGYTYLFNFVDSILRLFGFDTFKGVYHKLYFQRKSLACDLMEPFRCLIDKALLKAYNLNQIDPKDFILKDGTYTLDYRKSGKYSKIFLEAIMNNKESIYTYLRKYYLHIMYPTKYKFPNYKLPLR